MHYLEAAFKVLSERNGGPLSVRDITAIAVSEGILKTKSKTPEASMGAALYADTKTPHSRFRKTGPGSFALQLNLDLNDVRIRRVQNTLRPLRGHNALGNVWILLSCIHSSASIPSHDLTTALQCFVNSVDEPMPTEFVHAYVGLVTLVGLVCLAENRNPVVTEAGLSFLRQPTVREFLQLLSRRIPGLVEVWTTLARKPLTTGTIALGLSERYGVNWSKRNLTYRLECLHNLGVASETATGAWFAVYPALRSSAAEESDSVCESGVKRP